MHQKLRFGFLIVLGFVASIGSASTAQSSASGARALVTQSIDERVTVVLSGNTRSEANALNDRGRVEDALPLEHMQLLLQRPPEMEAELNQLINELHDSGSPLFHQWLTAAQFEAKFSVAAADIAAVSDWLAGNGFTVNAVVAGHIVDFSGNAGEVRAAFHTEIHNLDVNGEAHFANMTDPSVPAALSPVVSGIVSLHNFRPHMNFKRQFTFTEDGDTEHAVTPQDLAVIYNLNPLWSAGISGQGQTIALIEDSDVFSTADWSTFRSEFGLSGFSSGSFTQLHPAPSSGKNNCTDPKVVSGNEEEAELDVEYASAAAPSAAIQLLSCADTSTTFGGLIALENELSSAKTLPGTVSISFGECEPENGATANAAFSSTYQEAVTLGVSVFVSAGDEGAASCDADESKATHGISVSGFASTAFNVAVGGTDFGDTFAGTTATFWSSTNSSTFESALSYINEIPWNDSCASALIAQAEGFSAEAGSSGFCNSRTGEEDFLTTASGSGGPSGCFTGKPSTSGEVSGTCKGNPKPSFQSVLGNPSDGVRDLPDVSLFAANGVWGHFYIFCDSDTRDGGATCSGSPSGWSAAGGTSFASPIWAGFQALVNQKAGGLQGNPNTVYYKLASQEYGSSGSTSCNSSQGNAVGSSCIFYDVTQGDMDVNCTGKVDCFLPSGRNGVLSTSSSSDKPAYGTTTGWDFATGIGTVNVANLVNNWP
jgi:subtilase family serine protease